MSRAGAAARRSAASGLLLAASILAAVHAPAILAAPVVMQVGADRIVIDTPAGYSDTAFIGSPRLNEFAESLLPEGNRILVFALSDADVRRFSLGETPDLRRILLLAVPRSLEGERVSREQFAAMSRQLFGNLGEAAPAGADAIKFLEGKPDGLAQLLAELRNEATVRSVLQGTRTPPKSWFGNPSYRLSTGSLLLLGNKAMSLTVITTFDNPADLEWIRGVTERWIELLQKLNR